MDKKYGIVKKIYKPNDNNNDIMSSMKIGFVVEIDDKLYKFETEQDEEVCEIMKDDKVEMITQVIGNHKFVDIKKTGDRNNE